MGWITSFAGLRKVGASPWLAAAAVVVVFLVTKMASSGDTVPAE